jgi:hypothetical protein
VKNFFTNAANSPKDWKVMAGNLQKTQNFSKKGIFIGLFHEGNQQSIAAKKSSKIFKKFSKKPLQTVGSDV